MRRIAVLLLISCSGGVSTAPGPTGPTSPTPDAPAPIALSPADCEALVMHVTLLAVAEQGSATDPERDKVRAGLEPLVAECRSLAPAIHRCTLASKTLAEVSACQPRAGASDDAK